MRHFLQRYTAQCDSAVQRGAFQSSQVHHGRLPLLGEVDGGSRGPILGRGRAVTWLDTWAELPRFSIAFCRP